MPQAIGQAAGAASLPFLASLFSKREVEPFARSVNESVSRITAFSFLLSAWMIPAGAIAVDFFFRGGLFARSDATTMALYFAVFALSLCFWSAQAIYARAFYATGNTFTPMLAATGVVLVSLPIYALFFHWKGAVGLAWASDLGIAMQTGLNALLLHRRRLVPLGGPRLPGAGPLGGGGPCERAGAVRFAPAVPGSPVTRAGPVAARRQRRALAWLVLRGAALDGVRTAWPAGWPAPGARRPRVAREAAIQTEPARFQKMRRAGNRAFQEHPAWHHAAQSCEIQFLDLGFQLFGL